MNEDYLHYIWNFQLFPSPFLITTEGEKVQVLKKGFSNSNSGADFLEASVLIGDEKWFGNVEIHVNSSDWNKHKHQFDEAYNSVILHVVYENDIPISNQNGEKIPTVELKKLINKKHFEKYKLFLSNGLTVPCQNHLQNIDDFIINSTLERLAVARLERKTAVVFASLKKFKGDWEQTFISLLMQYFGMKVNAEAMKDLSKYLPYSILRKERSNLLSMEALIFGQAGLLSDVRQEDEYYESLRREYLYLKQKYKLQNLSKTVWKFSKLRPPNFPTLRLAQLSVLFYSYQHFFSLIREFTPIEEYREIFSITASDYWNTHYTFEKKSEKVKCKVGTTLIDNLLINVVVPLSFAYGKQIEDFRYCDYALKILSELPYENNNIIRLWKGLGVSVANAQKSQGAIELYTNYCTPKKCLLCMIGIKVLR